MFQAISQDPAINRARAMDRYLTMVKNCETSNDKKEFLRQQTTFRRADDDSDDDSDIPEADFDLDVLKPEKKKPKKEETDSDDSD
jgi:hypothetical protein